MKEIMYPELRKKLIEWTELNEGKIIPLNCYNLVTLDAVNAVLIKIDSIDRILNTKPKNMKLAREQKVLLDDMYFSIVTENHDVSEYGYKIEDKFKN